MIIKRIQTIFYIIIKMNLSKFNKNIKIGKNNYIEKYVKIHNNVTIGDNNKIYNGTVLYPNTIIGNNNVILNNNIIGEHPIHSNDIFKEKIFKGVLIGNNNFFHISNKIFGGYNNQTIIMNNNRFFAENHIGHDSIIFNNVDTYPRTLIGGYSKILDNAGIGAGTYIHQNRIIGNFSFTGMNTTVNKNSFPFFININNKYTKINYNKISKTEYYENIIKNENLLYEIKDKYINSDLDINEYCNKLPTDIYNIIFDFLLYK